MPATEPCICFLPSLRPAQTSRRLSHSPWTLGTNQDGEEERKTESSVQEVLAQRIVPLLDADGYNFLSAGREDLDVRMLGSGRPFVLEVRGADARRGGGGLDRCS